MCMYVHKKTCLWRFPNSTVSNNTKLELPKCPSAVEWIFKTAIYSYIRILVNNANELWPLIQINVINNSKERHWIRKEHILHDSISIKNKSSWKLNTVTKRPTITLLGIYTRDLKTYIHTKTWSWTFTAALLPMLKTESN